MSYKTLIVVLTLVLANATESFSAPKKAPTGTPVSPGATQSLLLDKVPAPPFKGPDRLLWDTWYTVTLLQEGPKGATRVPYAYYNDRLELKKDRLFYKNQIWKKEEGFINEEQLGAVADNKPDLSPIAFNFHSTYRDGETLVDGSVDGRTLTVKVSKGPNHPQIKKAFADKTFFSIFFPVWLGFRMGELKQGQTSSFRTILEDSIDNGFETVIGSMRLEPPDETATKSGTRKLAIDYGAVKTLWWVEPSGVALRIEAPQQGRLVERTTKSAAETFFSKF